MTYAEFIASPMLANYAAQENKRTGTNGTPASYAPRFIEMMDANYGHQWNRPTDLPPPSSTGIGGGPTAAGLNQAAIDQAAGRYTPPPPVTTAPVTTPPPAALTNPPPATTTPPAAATTPPATTPAPGAVTTPPPGSTTTPPPTTGATTTPPPANAALDKALADWRAWLGDPNATVEGLLDYWGKNAGTEDPSGKPQDFALLTALADSGDQRAIQLLTTAGYEKSGDTADLPVEQGVFNQVWPGLLKQIEGDTARQTEVERLTQQTGTAYGNLGNTLNLATPTVGADGSLTSPLLTSQLATAAGMEGATNAAANKAATDQLAGLNAAISQMQGNLSASLQAQAAELQKTVAALQTNLSTLDESQRRSLAEQIADQQRNLEASIKANQQALATEVAQLRGNTNTAAQARRQALEQELATLTAAQKPVADARIRAAEALVTAVNLGLQGTLDQLQATNALAGYIGGSTMQDAALARASIGARQEAAATRGQAEVANAMDSRQVSTYGAGATRGLEDSIATELQNIANYGTQGAATIARQEAAELQRLGDTAAAERRLQANTIAGERANLGAWGAGASFETANRGIADNLALQQSGAAGALDIGNAQTQQVQQAANDRAAQEAAAKNSVFSTGLQAGQLAATLPAQQAAAKASLIPYGTAGTKDALGTLNWFAPPAVNPPETTTILTNPSTAGNDIAGLGANLAATALGNADWWKPKTAPKTTVPSSLSMTGPKYTPTSPIWKFTSTSVNAAR